jgi:hypothetical protein
VKAEDLRGGGKSRDEQEKRGEERDKAFHGEPPKEQEQERGQQQGQQTHIC